MLFAVRQQFGEDRCGTAKGTANAGNLSRRDRFQPRRHRSHAGGPDRADKIDGRSRSTGAVGMQEVRHAGTFCGHRWPRTDRNGYHQRVGFGQGALSRTSAATCRSGPSLGEPGAARQGLARRPLFATATGRRGFLTINAGAVWYDARHAAQLTPDRLYLEADRTLYQAKRGGRNQTKLTVL